jgi:hypothetical protein
LRLPSTLRGCLFSVRVNPLFRARGLTYPSEYRLIQLAGPAPRICEVQLIKRRTSDLPVRFLGEVLVGKGRPADTAPPRTTG